MGIKVLKTLFAVIAIIIMVSPLALAGSLEPTAPPASTMKTLDEVEARTPISSLPFPINASGSYYITKNLTPPVSGQHGITIYANDVTVDLNGFALIGNGPNGNGINMPSLYNNICVKNGVIRGWGGNGIYLNNNSSGCNISDLKIDSNTGEGIYLGDNSIVRNCIVTNNGSTGIDADDNCTIANCVVSNNGSGIIVRKDGLVLDCKSNNNGFRGISITSGIISRCTASYNSNDGFFLSNGTIEECTAKSNTGDGIDILSNCTVRNNQSIGNTLKGINIEGAQSIIESNYIRNNLDGGIFAQAFTNGNIIIKNVCNGNFGTSGNYSVGTNNRDAQIINPAHGFVSTDPWANFGY